MRRISYYLGALLLAIIPFSSVLGESIEHRFNSMYNSTLVITSGSSSKLATTTTDDLTYTISGSSNAKFYLDLHNPAGEKIVSINLPSKDDQVVVASPTNAVGNIMVNYLPADVNYDKLRIYASADGVSYSGPLSKERDDGEVTADIPAGSHYIKIINEGSTAVSIYEINYTTENCNCFQYIPE